MQKESIQVLEKYKEHWHTLRDAGYIKHLEYPVKQELEKVYRKEIDKNFYYNLWCGDCVAEMVRRLYTFYEKFLQVQPAPFAIQNKLVRPSVNTNGDNVSE